MNKNLTDRQNEILQFIRDQFATNQAMPSYREIGSEFGISINSVFGHLKALAKKGAIELGENGKARSIRLVGLKMVIQEESS
jgi:SOS-response transcriptional repressor LexA